MDILQYINKMNRLYGNDTQVAKKDNIYPWGYDKNPPWAYIPKDPFDPGIHERFLEDFDVSKETMHATGGRVYDTRKYLQGGRVGYAYGDKVEKVRKFIKGKPNLNETAIKNYLKKIGYSDPSSAFAKLNERRVFKDVVIDAPIKTFSKETLQMKNAVIE